MKNIKYWFHNKIRSILEPWLTWWIAQAVMSFRRELMSVWMTSVGLDELEKIVEKGKQNREEFGHSGYESLAEILGSIVSESYSKAEKQFEEKRDEYFKKTKEYKLLIAKIKDKK